VIEAIPGYLKQDSMGVVWNRKVYFQRETKSKHKGQLRGGNDTATK